jgi:peptidoglycan/xylan/chitin deacetylase (PgdA/CDA1 family)
MTVNLLGIDFEDWYHPELIQKSLTSEKKTPSVINGLDKILNLLEKHETLATFFVVGELLEYESR